MADKELYSILNSKGELIGNYWASRPCKAGAKALKQIFRSTGKNKNVIFDIYNRMKKKLYKYRGNVRMDNRKFKYINGDKINILYKYEVERIILK